MTAILAAPSVFELKTFQYWRRVRRQLTTAFIAIALAFGMLLEINWLNAHGMHPGAQLIVEVLLVLLGASFAVVGAINWYHYDEWVVDLDCRPSSLA